MECLTWACCQLARPWIIQARSLQVATLSTLDPDIIVFNSTILIYHLLHYGKFFFSSNTLAVQTPKIILKLLLKTFSFSSNSDFFHAIEFLILRTLKNARNNAWTSQNHAKYLGVLFSLDAMSKERQLYRLNVWCTVRVERDLRMSKKYFIDVLTFPLFGKSVEERNDFHQWN